MSNIRINGLPLTLISVAGNVLVFQLAFLPAIHADNPESYLYFVKDFYLCMLIAAFANHVAFYCAEASSLGIFSRFSLYGLVPALLGVIWVDHTLVLLFVSAYSFDALVCVLRLKRANWQAFIIILLQPVPMWMAFAYSSDPYLAVSFANLLVTGIGSWALGLVRTYRDRDACPNPALLRGVLSSTAIFGDRHVDKLLVLIVSDPLGVAVPILLLSGVVALPANSLMKYISVEYGATASTPNAGVTRIVVASIALTICLGSMAALYWAGMLLYGIAFDRYLFALVAAVVVFRFSAAYFAISYAVRFRDPDYAWHQVKFTAARVCSLVGIGVVTQDPLLLTTAGAASYIMQLALTDRTRQLVRAER